MSPRRRWPHRLARAATAVVLALSFAGIGRLALPSQVGAIDCNLVNHPFAADDPEPGNEGYYTVLEDGGQLQVADIYGVLANDGCKAGVDSLTGSSPTGGHWDIFLDGAISFTPDADFSGAAHDDYFFHGTYGVSNLARATITVTPVNDQPYIWIPGSASCPAITVAEDSSQFLDPTCAYYEEPGGGSSEETQTFHRFVTTDHPELFSSLTFVETKTTYPRLMQLHFTPAANAHGSALLTFGVRDSGGTANGGVDTSLTMSRNVTITSVNDAPVATNDSYATPAGHALVVAKAKGVLANDHDVDNAAITSSASSSPSHGSLTLAADGSFTYVPNGGYFGPDSFTYKVGDGALTDTGTAIIAVAAPGATPPPTPSPTAAPRVTPPPLPTPAPGASTVPAASAPPPSSEPVSSESAAPVAVVSPGASSIPSLTAASPASSAEGTQPTTTGGPDQTPWIILLMIVVLLVIGGNFALRQYLKSKQPPPRADPGP